jgi:hypothetical protein
VENYTAFDYPFDRIKRLYDINVHGAFFTAREAARNMIPVGGGSIVLVASMSANVSSSFNPLTVLLFGGHTPSCVSHDTLSLTAICLSTSQRGARGVIVILYSHFLFILLAMRSHSCFEPICYAPDTDAFRPLFRLSISRNHKPLTTLLKLVRLFQHHHNARI